MSLTRPWKPSNADDALKEKIEALKKAEAKAFASRKRFRERAWLQAVYRQFCIWADKNCVGNRTKRLLRLYKIDARKGRDLIWILIEISSQETNPKKKSRWANALRAALRHKVKPQALNDFFDQNEGVAGAATK
jgi:hypothetical protein